LNQRSAEFGGHEFRVDRKSAGFQGRNQVPRLRRISPGRIPADPDRCIVLHADDFGMNRAVTDGIMRGFTHGLLTSTALLANAPDAGRALQVWRSLEQQSAAGRLPSTAARRALDDGERPFELGIHLNLTQGRPLTGSRYPSDLLDDEGQFCGISALFRRLYRARSHFQRALQSELRAQIEFLLDHGRRPSHLNGHQYIEMLPGLRDAIGILLVDYGIQTIRVARESGLFRSTVLHGGRPAAWCLAHVKRHFAGRLLRSARGWDVQFADAYFGTAHAGHINLESFATFLRCGNRETRIEIALHPADAATFEGEGGGGWNDPLAALRPKELELLTDESLIGLLQSFGRSLGRLSTQEFGKAAKAA
jgi:chitin disaccharide deacetylase